MDKPAAVRLAGVYAMEGWPMTGKLIAKLALTCCAVSCGHLTYPIPAAARRIWTS